MATAAAAAVEAVKTLDTDRGGLEREPGAGARRAARRHGRRHRRARVRPGHRHRHRGGGNHRRQPRQGHWHGRRVVHAEPAVVDHRVRSSPRGRAAEQRRLRGRRHEAAALLALLPRTGHRLVSAFVVLGDKNHAGTRGSEGEEEKRSHL